MYNIKQCVRVRTLLLLSILAFVFERFLFYFLAPCSIELLMLYCKMY